MKNLLVICIIMFGMNVNAQEPVAAIELSELNVLYRGYANKILPAVYNNNGGTLFLFGEGVSISKTTDGKHFIAKAMGTDREVSISVHLINGTDTTFLRKVNYRVMNIPDPNIYWGTARNGERANIRETELFVRYGPEIPLAAQFSVRSWELTVDSTVVSSIGNNLEKAEEVLKQITKPTTVSMLVKVISPDGIMRLRAAAWMVDPWEETEDR